MFVETWLRDFPGDVLRHLHAHHYMAHHLSATMSCVPAMHDHHSILVLLEDRWHASSIQQQCRDFGKYVKLDLQVAFRLVAVYNTPTTPHGRMMAPCCCFKMPTP